jgi:2-phospho-L-lactate guanylyltransferase (CobY/MobA/RfbA family)
MDDETIKVGLLMETAHAQQALVDKALEQLNAHVRELDTVVRDEIRHTLVEELRIVVNETNRSAEALRRLRRAANLRIGLWTLGLTVVCSAIPLGLAWWLLPSPNEITALRATRDDLASAVARLEQRGARVDLRRCGGTNRLCVRVDRKAPAYGEAGDYLVVKGY